MRRIPKLVRVVAAVGAASLIATACGGDDEPAATDGDTTTDGTTTDGDTDGDAMGNADGIVRAYIVEPRSLITTDAAESEGIKVLKTICRGLTYLTNDGELVMMAAESVTTDDNTTWTIKLKPGQTFHDGSTLDAQDYVDTWNYGATAANGQQNNGFYNIIDGYEAMNPEDPDGEDGPQTAPDPTADSLSGLAVVDDTTFTVTLTGPNTTFPLRLPYAAYYAMPSEVVTGGADAISAYNESPVCNGPYQIEGGWQHDVEIKTVAWDGYTLDDAPVNGGVDFSIQTDSTTAWQEFIAGNLDVIGVPSEFLDQAKADYESAGRFFQQPSDSFAYFGFPVYDEKFADPKLRQALSMAVDRQAIVDTILNGNGVVAHSWIAPVIPGHRENPCDNGSTELDLEAAKAMFDEAGGFDGTMTLWVNSGNKTAEQWVTAIGNMWKNAFGIEFELQQLPFAEYLDLYYGSTFTGPFRLGWGMDYPHPQNYLEPLYGSAEGHTGYSSTEFDDLVKKGNAEAELDAAIPSYQAAEDLLCEDMPVIPLYFGVTTIAYNDTLEKVVLDGYGDYEFNNIVVAAS